MIQACLYGNSFLVSRINFLQSKEGASFSLCALARFSMLSNISLECSAMTFGCVRLSMSTHMHCLQEKKPRNYNSNAVNTNLIGDSRGLGSVSSDILFAGKSSKVATKTEDATPVPRNSFILCGQIMYPSGATISFPELDTRTSSVQKS